MRALARSIQRTSSSAWSDSPTRVDRWQSWCNITAQVAPCPPQHRCILAPMERRVFLQLLGITAAAVSLPKDAPLLVTEGSPPLLDRPHFIIDRGSFTGRTFNGDLWTSGRNAGLVRQKPFSGSFQYALKDLRQAPCADIPGVPRYINQALSAFRAQLHRDLLNLVKAGRGSSDVKLVTVIGGPLHARLWSNTKVEVSPRYENYLVQGELKPYRVWSNCGRVPLQTDFADSGVLHAWLDAQVRQKISLDPAPEHARWPIS